MKRTLINPGFWNQDNGRTNSPGSLDVNRIILDTLVAKGLASTTDCCTYTLPATEVDCESLSENQANTYYVDPNGNNTTAVPGSTHCPYFTINAAVSAAGTAGGVNTVRVNPGSYSISEPIDFSVMNGGTLDISPGAVIFSPGNYSPFNATGTSPSSFRFTGGGRIICSAATKFCIQGNANVTIAIDNISLQNQVGSVIGGAWGTLHLNNVSMEADLASVSVTSTDVTADVFSVSNISNTSELGTLTWMIQPLFIDPAFILP